MKLRERIDRLDRLQRSRWFKIVASVVVVALAVAVVLSYVVRQAADDKPFLEVQTSEPGSKPEDAKTPEEKRIAEEISAQRTAAESTARFVNSLMTRRTDASSVGVGAAIVVALALSVIWLGIGLTALGIVLAIAALALPMWMLGERRGIGWLSGLGKFTAAIGALTFAFVVLMEVLRALLSGSSPVTAIARNVVNEAVRIKVSLVFIVLIVFGLAALPGLLDESTPLRYRVQAFMQYATGGTFWLIAALTLFLAVGSVAFEQRDKIIWQTMTKPVAAWQYLLGKWLGVVGVSAVLLGVSCSGIFMFVEHLRDQRAMGEERPYLTPYMAHLERQRQGSTEGFNGDVQFASEDRFVLETQVLTARSSVGPTIPPLTDESLAREIETRAQRQLAMNDPLNPKFRNDIEDRAKIAQEIETERITQFLTLEPANRRVIEFKGLGDVKASGRPMTLRYRVSVGADDPRQTHRLSFAFQNLPPVVQQVPLGQNMSLDVNPAAISNDGTLQIMVINADIMAGIEGVRTMSFPPDGLEVYFPVSSYHSNFLRAVLVLWLKLAFLAMVGVCAATFLSFSVASVVAFGVFFLAETAAFLSNSLDYYYPQTAQGEMHYHRYLVRAIAVPIVWIFKTYSTINPTEALVDGRLLSWPAVGAAVAVLSLLILCLYALGVFIFRGRELATYSGQ